MAVHRGTNTTFGYSRLWATGHRVALLDHRVIHQAVSGKIAEHVHHKDENKLNNLPSNLEGMSASSHTHYTGTKRWSSPPWGKHVRAVGQASREQLREHLQQTEYPLAVPFCRYQPNNHRIVKVEELPDSVDVYDIEIEDTHNFIANELCVHNSSKNVNLQNIPKRSSLAKEFRKMLVAAPGCLLLEADSSAIEAVLVGYHAGDEGYIRAAKAGIHSFITSNWIKEPVSLSLPDAELKIALKEVKKAHPDRYESAKRGGHATNYLLTPYGLYDEYPEYFKSQREAEQFQEFYFDLFPKIRQWHQHTLDRVHHDGYLDNHFGYRHRFFDVYRYDGSYGKWKLGNDAKRVIAFSPQSDGSAIQSEYLLWVAENEEIRNYLRLLIHDSFIFEFPEKRLDTVAQWVHSCMSRPVVELGGLTVGAEVSYGRNLGEMQVMDF